MTDPVRFLGLFLSGRFCCLAVLCDHDLLLMTSGRKSNGEQKGMFLVDCRDYLKILTSDFFFFKSEFSTRKNYFVTFLCFSNIHFL